MVKLMIDGRPAEVGPGRTVLEAASAARVYIPTLCNDLRLAPFGGCRMCLVRIEGFRGFVPACSTPAAEGMVVHTSEPELNELRRDILELILSEHPSACIACEDREPCFKYNQWPGKAGRCTGCRTCPNKDNCDLYKVADHLGVKDIRYEMSYRGLPLHRDDPFLDRDYNLCILCGKCVRTCGEVRGASAISFTQRSGKALVGTAFDRPLADSGCIFCGACIDVCPTGTLSEKKTKWQGVPDRTASTVCVLCPAGCAVSVDSSVGRATNSRPAGGHNGGQLCLKGRFCIAPLSNSAARLRYPMIRKSGVLRPVTWEEAMAFTAEMLRSFKPEETGFIASPSLTNEAAYLLQKLARTAVGSDNIALASRLASPALEALETAGPRGTMEDLGRADTILLAGTDLLLSAPVLLVPIIAARRRGARVVLVDDSDRAPPRWVDLSVRPESFRGFFEEVARLLGPGSAAGEGPATELAGLLRSGKAAAVFGVRLAEREGAGAIRALAGLMEAADCIALLPAWDGGNVQGALEMGAQAGLLPGQRRLESRPDRERLEAALGGRLPASPGRSDIALRGTRFLLATQALERVPEGVEFLAVLDEYASPLTERADAVFPAADITESSGTVTSLEGRVQRVSAAGEPVGMALEDWDVLARLARALGAEWARYQRSSEVTDELARAVPGFSLDLLPPRPLKLRAGGGTGGQGAPFARGCLSHRGLPIAAAVDDFEAVLRKWGVVR